MGLTMNPVPILFSCVAESVFHDSGSRLSLKRFDFKTETGRKSLIGQRKKEKIKSLGHKM